MLLRPVYLVALLLMLLVPAASADDVLKSLSPQHPRIYMSSADFERVKKLSREDPLAKKWHVVLSKEAEKMLDQPPVEHVLIGPRLLDKSRTALTRVSTLAALYRIDGDPRFLQRAKKELLAVAAFKDWNPSHFLDVAEMTNAVAVGYDWLYPELSPEERTALRTAIVEKGLKPGLEIYDAHRWWTKATHNWNQVCNGGMTAGALAIADEERDLATRIVAAGRESIPLAMKSWGPDGGWAEGPGYWGYATQYNVFYLAALESALKTDFGLLKTPGFAACGEFRMAFVGPTGQTFDFADAHPGAGVTPQMFWLARTFNRPDYDAHERSMVGSKVSIFHLLWFNPNYNNASLASLPASHAFKGVDVAFLRSDRKDNEATFVGFKGGDNKANHSHLDLGTFVLDMQGQRFAMDLGADYYNLPGYFGNKRFTYYRLKTEGHNTLVVNNQNQDTSAKAPIVAFKANDQGRSFAVADLTAAYKPAVSHALRGVEVIGRERVIVQDEIAAADPAEFRWQFHTDADVKIEGSAVLLSKSGKRVRVQILSPAGVTFETNELNFPAPQLPAPSERRVGFRLPEKAKSARIVVQFSPEATKPEGYTIRPLEMWGK